MILKWKTQAILDVEETPEIILQAEKLISKNLKSKDALHIACALYAGCTYFLTTDDKILNKNHLIDGIEVINPVQLINKLENNE